MSSADIKKWLVEEFKSKGKNTQEKEWKRRSKSKNPNGEEVRIFEHPTLGQHTVIEDKNGSFRFDTLKPSTHSQTLFERFPPTEDDIEMAKDLEIDFVGQITLCSIGEDTLFPQAGVWFELGFELEDGNLLDESRSIIDLLNYIFKDRPDNTLSPHVMEATHRISLMPNETIPELMAYILNKLQDEGVSIALDDEQKQEILKVTPSPSSTTPSEKLFKPYSFKEQSYFDVEKALKQIFGQTLSGVKPTSNTSNATPLEGETLFEKFPPTPMDRKYNSASDFSGRIILCSIEDEGDFFIAFCGFEMADGTLLDDHSEATTAMMNYIFPGWQASGKMYTQIQENAHAFYGKEGELFALQEEVIAALEKAGVVKAPYFESNIEPPPKPPRKTGWRN